MTIRLSVQVAQGLELHWRVSVDSPLKKPKCSEEADLNLTNVSFEALTDREILGGNILGFESEIRIRHKTVYRSPRLTNRPTGHSD